MIDIDLTRQHVFSAVKTASVDRDPFAHFRLEKIFPESVYQTLINNLPNPNLYHEIRHQDALRPDGTSTRTMLEFHDEEFARLDKDSSRIWSAVRDVLCAPELQELIFEKFALEINERVDSTIEQMKLTRNEAGRIVAYPRPALYRDAAGYRITPHPDTPLKIVTMQFYLPENDSQSSLGTSLYRQRTKLQKALMPWSTKYRPVKKFPFLPNSGYAFAVTRNSWHGREKIAGRHGDRYSIITFYLRDDVRLKY